MEQGLKEFIEETKLKIPSDFGRIITPLLSNVDNPEPNPLYYQENIFGFKKTLEERIVKTSITSLILNNYVSSLTNLFQDIVLIFVHIYNESVKDVDTSIKNYFNSLKEVELYNQDVLNQQLIIDNDELIEAIGFMITGLNEMVSYFNRFSKVDLKSTLLRDSLFNTIDCFDETLLKIKVGKVRRANDLQRFINGEKVNNKEQFILALVREFGSYKGKKLANVFNILYSEKIILYPSREGKNFHSAIELVFENEKDYKNFKKHFPNKLENSVKDEFGQDNKRILQDEISLIKDWLSNYLTSQV
tara:strand:+ start:195 stop:1103 length:909 start_codon:yes stop_codon:yes gene_type:complete